MAAEYHPNPFVENSPTDTNDQRFIETILGPEAARYFSEIHGSKQVDHRPIDFSAFDLNPGESRLIQEKIKTPLGEAEEIMQENFLGPAAVKEAWGVELSRREVPRIPFSTTELERAKELEELLILRISRDARGRPLTLENVLQSSFEKYESIDDLSFYTAEIPRFEWALTQPRPFFERGGNNLVMIRKIKNYLEEQVFHGIRLPKDYDDAVWQLGLKFRYDEYLDGGEFSDLNRKLASLQINKLLRHRPVELVYDELLARANKQKLLYNDTSTVTNHCDPQTGKFVAVENTSNANLIVFLQNEIQISFSRQQNRTYFTRNH